MNILVIGNGFDLAHGLPTKYTDFLEWIKKYLQFYSYLTRERTAENKETNESILKYFYKLFYDNANENIYDEIYYLIYDNLWIEYFQQSNMYGAENWIDFESEISDIIQSLDNDMRSKDDSLDKSVFQCSNFFLNNRYCSCLDDMKPRIHTYRMIRDELLDGLNKLIRVFEIYLAQYVEKIDCNLVSPDIQCILPKEIAKYNGEPVYDTYILSFNYTNSYQRLYIDKVQDKYFDKYVDYIHGKADINNTVETNNMVLGIDEYLPKKRRNKDVEFIAFKKYYQRIHKGTGCKYKDWVDEIKINYKKFINNQRKLKNQSSNGVCQTQNFTFKAMKPGNEVTVFNTGKYEKHNLYIFGHSLDITDRDILRDLILNDNIYTTIFYHNKDVMGQQIANLVKVIGQDELIRRTGGSTKTIEFKQQQDMIPYEK